jgi:hypothetical protein
MPDYNATIRRAARRYGVSPKILYRQLQAESGLNPNARSNRGAQGIAQFIPSTARAYGVNLNDGNPTDDIFGAAHYMRDNLKRSGGDYASALRIYNSGSPTGHSAETNGYVQKILGGGATPDQPITESGGDTTGASSSTDRRSLLLNYFHEKKQHDPHALLNLALAMHSGGGGGGGGAAPAGGGPQADVSGGGVADFEGHKVAGWIAPALQYARQQGWQGQVNSGYRSFADQQRIYNSGVRPAAKPGTSNHEGAQYPRGAVDVSDAQQLSNILKHSRWRKRLQYAGAKDPVHFSHPHGGSY